MTGPLTINVSCHIRPWVSPLLNALQAVAPRVVPRRMQPTFINVVAAIIVRFGMRMEVRPGADG